MSQQFPTEDPKRPRAPWEEPFIGDDADASISYGEDIFMGGATTGGETEQLSSSPQLPTANDVFPWQVETKAANSKTTSSAPLPWEDRDIPDQSTYRSSTAPQTPPPSGPSKNLLQPKKLTFDIWQNVPLWGYVTATAVIVMSVGGMLWTANSIPKDLDAQPSALAGKNNATGTSIAPATSTSSVPVRPMRSRVSPGASSSDSSTPGYVPEAAPVGSSVSLKPKETVSSPDPTAPGAASTESPSKSYMSPLASSSATGTAAGGPQNPFSPAYPKAPKPKPVVAPKPVVVPKPQPLPPPKALPAVLSLEGVATDGKTKFAIVRVGDQPLTAEVQVGANVEGWTVATITNETVTLTKGKQRKVLRLP